MTADWVEHAMWWHVYPLGFVGAEPASDGVPVTSRLDHLVGWLDTAVELGLSGLALGPVFASETHGYDTVDHFRVDPRLGDEADLARLFEAAHARGLRVLLDGVFHHVGRGHPAFREVLEQGPSAPRADWFHLRWEDGRSEPRYRDFEGHAGLVALQHDHPAVVDHVVDVMTHWLRAGADGWRLDAAYAVPDRFWAQVLPRVRAEHPQAYVVGEVIHGDHARTVRASGMDAVTQYELWKALWSSVVDRNLFELAHALTRHDALLDAFVPYTFVGNHDVTRLATQIPDARHRPHALVALLTVAGTPAVYYGDEHGFEGRKEDRAGGDDAVRPAFPRSPGGLERGEVFRLHQELLGLRRRHPWLHRARTRQLRLTNTAFVYETAAGQDRLVVALNLDDRPLEHRGGSAVLAGTAELRDGTAVVPPHGWAVLAP